MKIFVARFGYNKTFAYICNVKDNLLPTQKKYGYDYYI